MSLVEEIQSIIEELKNNSLNVVNKMKKVQKMTEEQLNSVDKTEKKFGGISSAMDIESNIIKDINQSVDCMYENKEALVDLMQNLSAIAEENAAGTQEASASIEEQSAGIEEIANSSENLSNIAEGLQDLVKEFKI